MRSDVQQALVSALALILIAATPALAIEGVARVVDGDTIVISGTRVRLAGIDAPEKRQQCWRPTGGARAWACGRIAWAALEAMIGGRDVNCTPTRGDRYRRVVAVCRAGTVELNREMVREGWALAYSSISRAYAGDEADARDHGRGMWGSSFLPPWAWRRR